MNYNTKHFIDICLQSVFAATKKIKSEIIVVDNGSIDGSINQIRLLFPDVVLIKNKKNLGFSKGVNIGVKSAKGKYICILNPDTIVSENSFELAINNLKKNPNIGIVGPKQINGFGDFLKESKRNIPTPLSSLKRIAGFDLLFSDKNNQYYNLTLNNDQSGYTDVLVGSFMFTTKKHFDLLNGLDEEFFMYGEDIDFCIRSLKVGKKNYYNSSIKIIHFKGKSTTKNFSYAIIFGSAITKYYKKYYKQNPIYLFMSTFISFLFGISKMISDLSIFKKKITSLKYLIISDYKLEFKNKRIEKIFVPNLISCKKYKNNNTTIIMDFSKINFVDTINFIERNKTKFSYGFLSSNRKFIVGGSKYFPHGNVTQMCKS